MRRVNLMILLFRFALYYLLQPSRPSMMMMNSLSNQSVPIFTNKTNVASSVGTILAPLLLNITTTTVAPDTTTLDNITTVLTTTTEPYSASSSSSSTQQTTESLSSELLNHIGASTTSPISSSASTILSAAPNASDVQVTMPISLPTSTHHPMTQPTSMKTTKPGSVSKSTTTKTRPKTPPPPRRTTTTTTTTTIPTFAPSTAAETGSYQTSTESLAAYPITNASPDALRPPVNSSTAVLLPPLVESLNFSSAIASISANESSTESTHLISNAQLFIGSNQTTATYSSPPMDLKKPTATIATLLMPAQNINQTADSNNYTTLNNLPISLPTTSSPLLNSTTEDSTEFSSVVSHSSTTTEQSTAENAQSFSSAGITLSPLNANNITSTSIVIIEKPVTSTERPAMMVTSLPISSPNVGKEILRLT